MAELDVSARRDLLVIAADGYGKRTPSFPRPVRRMPATGVR